MSGKRNCRSSYMTRLQDIHTSHSGGRKGLGSVALVAWKRVPMSLVQEKCGDFKILMG